MHPFFTISEDTTAFPWSKRTPGSGVLAVIAVGIALLVGWLTGHTAAGAIAAGSAFTVGFAVFHEALASVLLSMAVTTLGIASATLVGSLAAPWTPVVLLVIFVAAVNYGLLAGLGPTEGWIGQQSGVFVIVASYFTQGPQLCSRAHADGAGWRRSADCCVLAVLSAQAEAARTRSAAEA